MNIIDFLFDRLGLFFCCLILYVILGAVFFSLAALIFSYSIYWVLGGVVGCAVGGTVVTCFLNFRNR